MDRLAEVARVYDPIPKEDDEESSKPHSPSLGKDPYLGVPKNTPAQAHSDERRPHKRARKIKPPTLSLSPKQEEVHFPHCPTAALGPPPSDWLAILKTRLETDNPYIKLIAIKEALIYLRDHQESREYLLILLAKALDSLTQDSQRVLEGLDLPVTTLGTIYRPCSHLRNIPALLDAISSHLDLSPRHVFGAFRERFFPLPRDSKAQEPTTSAPREETMKMDLKHSNKIDIARKFASLVVPAAKSYSVVDGWDDIAVQEEFGALWALLKTPQQASVRAILAKNGSFPPINREISAIMGITSSTQTI